MNKQDIKNGMIFIERSDDKYYIIEDRVFIKLKNKIALEFVQNLNTYLDMYNNELENLYNSNGDITEVWDMSGNVLWEKEEDWATIPIGTKVLVRNREDEVWQPKVFVNYRPHCYYKFRTLSEDLSGVQEWRFCKLIEE